MFNLMIIIKIKKYSFQNERYPSKYADKVFTVKYDS